MNEMSRPETTLVCEICGEGYPKELSRIRDKNKTVTVRCHDHLPSGVV